MLMGGSAAAAEQTKARNRESLAAVVQCESILMVFISSLGCRLSGGLCYGREPRCPGAAPPVKLLHRWHAQRLGIVPEHAMKRPPLPVPRNERHRVVFPVHLGLGLRQHFDRMIPDQARVELVLSVEVRHAEHDRMGRYGQLDTERAKGIMLAHSRARSAPRAAGHLGELRPLAEPCAARKVY